MTDARDVDERLSELGKRTEALRARSGFDERVLAAVAAQAALGLEMTFMKSLRRFVPLCLVAAGLSVAWALVSAQETDAAFAAAEDTVEMEW